MSSRPPSAALRAAHKSTTFAAPSTPSDQNVASWSGDVQHDLATVVGEGRPPIDERAHVVRLGRFEPAHAERAHVARQVGPALPGGGHRDGRAGQRVLADLGRHRDRIEGCEPLEVFGHPRRPHRDVDLIGAGVGVPADRVDDLFVGSGQDARADALGEGTELLAQALVGVREPHVDRAHDRRRDRGRRRSQCSASTPRLRAKSSGEMNGHVPRVGVLGGDAQRALLAAAADPDRQFGLHGLRVAPRLGQREVLTLEVRHFLAQEQPDALHRFFEDVEPLAGRRERDAVGLVLVERPAGTEPEVGATATQVVDRRDRVREHRRVPVAGAVDERAASHPGRFAGERGVRRDRFEALQSR